MKKSLNIGVFDPKLIYTASPYPGDNVFAKGLEQNKYEVVRFDYRAAVEEPNNELIRLAMSMTKKPDIVWIGKAERISPITLKILRQAFPVAIFVKWFADMRDNPTDIDLEHNRFVDWCFGTAGGDYLKKFLLPNMKGVCSILTFTDSDFYKTILTEDRKWDSDVLWTGRKGFGNNSMRNEIIDCLSNEKEFDIKIFGLTDWIGNPEYLYAINNTKIGIGSNSFNRTKYSSDRLGNYMSCGTFYLTQYIEGIEECFKRGKHLDWFNSIDELKEKIKYYLEHDDKRIKIAKQGQKFVKKHFDCKPLVSNLLKIIKTKKSKNKWDDLFVN